MEHLSNRSRIYSMRDLQSHYQRTNGGHWFDPGTMRFFKTRLSEHLFYGATIIYFVSSEQGPNGIRRYSVRSYTPETGEIDTVGEFQQYRTRDQAKRAAAKAAASN